MIYTFYIFNRHGNCIYYQDWGRTVTKSQSVEDEKETIYGFLWALKQFIKNISPVQEDKGTFHFYKTTAYKMHFFETPTNFKFIITSDPDVNDLRETLKNIYKNVFVEYVSKNALYDPEKEHPITCDLFIERLNSEIKSLPAFRSIAKSQ